ncbi:MAG: succinate dehydrogenase assembly factor 2 [Pseudomonadota bacterium]|nr:succinate dehydrogenase assembly factor 2 [Pseudomonadota bacterium]
MEEDERRALWRSRRGLLELDLILVPFVENCFASLPDRLRSDYLDLLTVDDVDAYAWLVSGESVPSRYKQIIDVVRRFVGGET